MADLANIWNIRGKIWKFWIENRPFWLIWGFNHSHPVNTLWVTKILKISQFFAKNAFLTADNTKNEKLKDPIYLFLNSEWFEVSKKAKAVSLIRFNPLKYWLEFCIFGWLDKIMAFSRVFYSQTKIYPKNPKKEPPSQPLKLPCEHSGLSPKVAGVKKSQNENAIYSYV